MGSAHTAAAEELVYSGGPIVVGELLFSRSSDSFNLLGHTTSETLSAQTFRMCRLITYIPVDVVLHRLKKCPAHCSA